MKLSTSNCGRLLVNPAMPAEPQAAAEWNMALDEVMLERAAADQELCLRFYSWAAPTVSMGYFQSIKDRQSHGTSVECPLVRRNSGGGALIHGTAEFDLTYAVAVPTSTARGALTGLYDCFHDALVEVLTAAGLEAARCVVDRGEVPKPFLCFQRHTAGDVLIGKHKVGGSAQRRLGSAVLQHGTLLIDQIPEAPELPGVSTLHPDPEWQPVPDQLSQHWLDSIANRWPVDWQRRPLDDSAIERVRAKANEKYGSTRWTQRR